MKKLTLALVLVTSLFSPAHAFASEGAPSTPAITECRFVGPVRFDESSDSFANGTAVYGFGYQNGQLLSGSEGYPSVQDVRASDSLIATIPSDVSIVEFTGYQTIEIEPGTGFARVTLRVVQASYGVARKSGQYEYDITERSFALNDGYSLSLRRSLDPAHESNQRSMSQFLEGYDSYPSFPIYLLTQSFQVTELDPQEWVRRGTHSQEGRWLPGVDADGFALPSYLYDILRFDGVLTRSQGLQMVHSYSVNRNRARTLNAKLYSSFTSNPENEEFYLLNGPSGLADGPSSINVVPTATGVDIVLHRQVVEHQLTLPPRSDGTLSHTVDNIEVRQVVSGRLSCQ